MTKKDREIIKAFVDSSEMFHTITGFVVDLKEPEYNGGSLADFGALILAHREMKAALLKRFDDMKLAAQFEE